ncbi:hypothetical protein ACB092_11G265900 [Castanea dentata]
MHARETCGLWEHATNSRHTSTSSAFSKMNERMRQAAESGNINALPQLIGEDVNVLDHIDQEPFIQTPLHVAASAGHIQFATKMMILKASFAHKLNPDGFSPIHLALQNGHIELVRQLVEIDSDLVRVKGNESITPLHYVVETGDCHIDLLDKFLLVCPDSIKDVTAQDETALHIALKNDQLKAFKFLVGWLGRNFFKNSSSNLQSVLDQKDMDKNTVLHITVSKNHTHVVGHLLAWGSRFVNVNSKNSEGKTAWDVSQGQTQENNSEIKLMLHSAGASSGSSLSTATRSDDNNIDEFYNLIGEDEELLESIDKRPFVNTPFHIAASYGNIQFAKEIMGLKPSFARKLNQNGLSPIHLALKNEHIELVHQLLQFDGDLVRAKGRECLTPLHYLVATGDHHLDLLRKFLLVCPDSIADVTVRNETVLHIALKYDMLKAFDFLVEWLRINCSENAESNEKSVMNWKNNEGNTVLHIATLKNQTKAVRRLLAWDNKFLGVNHKNIEGKTAWDILQDQRQVDNRKIRVMLRRAEAKPASPLSTFNSHPNHRRLPLSTFFVRFRSDINRQLRKLSEESRSMLLVVTVLLITVSYQAILTPPRGLWQDNGKCNNTAKEGSSNAEEVCEHKAGTAIALEDPLFVLFLLCNFFTFAISNLLIVLLDLNGQIRPLFFVLNVTLCFSYLYSFWAIMADPFLAFILGAFSIGCLIFALISPWKQ